VIGVRIAHAEPRLEKLLSGPPLDPRLRGLHPRGFLVVLAEEAGHRAMPAWVPDRPGATPLPDLLDRSDDDIWTTAGIPEELLIRLLNAEGVAITAVDILPLAADATNTADAADEVTEQTAATRIELGGGRYVEATLDVGLALAAIAGAPVRVAEDLMDRLGVPVPDDDPAAPFRAQEPEPGEEKEIHVVIDNRAGRVFQLTRDRPVGRRPRHEPRNLAFGDGLDWWELDTGFREETLPQDYSVGTDDGRALLSATAAEPRGSAVLVQAVFADDFRGAAIVFGAEFRTDGVEGRAGLCLEILRPGWRVRPDRGEDRVVTATGSQDWTRQEVSADIPEDTDLIRFGIVLSGRGRVWMRNPELRTARPGG
jgi:hypothetical protein